MTSAVEQDLPLQCLYRWSEQKPRSLFLSQPFDQGQLKEWTWSQAADEIRRMAAYLKNQGWEPETRVAILSRNCAWWIMADLAIWMAGYVTVPIYPSLTAESVRAILEHSGARACFVGKTDDSATADIPPDVALIYFPTADVNTYPSWDNIIDVAQPIAGSPVRPADALATIIYTSGTTGTPKGVMHRFGSLAFNARALENLLEFEKGQRFFSYLPLAHIVERAGLEGTALLIGASIHFAASIETFLTDLRRAKPTIFLSVPRLLLKFQQGVYEKMAPEKLARLLRIPLVNRPVRRRVLGQLGLISVRQAACGAAPLPPELMAWYRSLGLELAEGYGMTETLITHLPGRGKVRIGFVGAAISPEIECRISAAGELQIRSPMNMMGYYRDERNTTESFTEDGFFRTGDLAEIAADGQLRIIGRIKEQFKTSKGKYVAPAPIESKLAAHPSVESCCLMGAGLPCPAAVVVLTDQAQQECDDPFERQKLAESLQELLVNLNAQLESFERVSCLVVVSDRWTVGNGAITPTLKIKRSVLEKRYMSLVENCISGKESIVWQPATGPQAGTAQNV